MVLLCRCGITLVDLMDTEIILFAGRKGISVEAAVAVLPIRYGGHGCLGVDASMPPRIKNVNEPLAKR